MAGTSEPWKRSKEEIGPTAVLKDEMIHHAIAATKYAPYHSSHARFSIPCSRRNFQAMVHQRVIGIFRTKPAGCIQERHVLGVIHNDHVKMSRNRSQLTCATDIPTTKPILFANEMAKPFSAASGNYVVRPSQFLPTVESVIHTGINGQTILVHQNM